VPVLTRRAGSIDCNSEVVTGRDSVCLTCPRTGEQLRWVREACGRRGEPVRAKLSQAAFQRRVFQASVDCAVELLDDRGGVALGSCYANPKRALVARRRLSNGGYVGQQIEPLTTSEAGGVF
jgi:hypothetical protein